MYKAEDLKRIISRIDGRGYKAYKEIEGEYELNTCYLYIDHAQADPFAPMSRIRLRVPIAKAGFPKHLYQGVKLTALEDIIARLIKKELDRLNLKPAGTGNSGLIFIDAGGQEVIKRTAVKITSEFIEARLSVGLPASGRTIKGQAALHIFLHILPLIAEKCLYYKELDPHMLEEHVNLFADQEYLREKLDELGLVAFVGNGAILPRRSGNSNLPLPAREAVKFKSPPDLQITITTPHHGPITGMGIRKGVTLITGGGFHGKSTLLKALERGVYNHIKGDGREWVITVRDAVKIRAEDGRNIEKVDISCFIDNLPFQKDTKSFSTENASGSTSQAANIMEALELGARLLLLDEDTSATNFMIRDERMQRLIAKDKEPITPFIDRVRQLYEEQGVSSILVIGGSGDYLEVADTVIMLDSYQVYNVTDKARKIVQEVPSQRIIEKRNRLEVNAFRIIKKASWSDGRHKKAKVAAKGIDTVLYGKTAIDLSAVEQLIDPGQTRAIAHLLVYMQRYVDDRRSLREIIDKVYEDIADNFEVISPFPAGQHPGDLVWVRPYELGAALNRLRTLQIK
ncbi:Predicted ATPase of the ABC class [Thermosyntropha lipolytica DSM 11003]|uniref:Predicted ATPase of the ABC class n=1 Tax=Thermosyntropha lipolytica DSM 11003 TaxID=1123382 RepID=A0A1M5L9Z8_9FIRM|nr:ABC-ATPase domain-containing protein [Thermosyntropha lipolytica]SHG61806.1 Predicted ATPase of the ABC class [Thermosyntropha lipolytica DSM 11003]